MSQMLTDDEIRTLREIAEAHTHSPGERLIKSAREARLMVMGNHPRYIQWSEAQDPDTWMPDQKVRCKRRRQRQKAEWRPGPKATGPLPISGHYYMQPRIVKGEKVPLLKVKLLRSKYLPHQNVREMERRRRKLGLVADQPHPIVVKVPGFEMGETVNA